MSLFPPWCGPVEWRPDCLVALHHLQGRAQLSRVVGMRPGQKCGASSALIRGKTPQGILRGRTCWAVAPSRSIVHRRCAGEKFLALALRRLSCEAGSVVELPAVADNVASACCLLLVAAVFLYSARFSSCLPTSKHSKSSGTWRCALLL